MSKHPPIECTKQFGCPTVISGAETIQLAHGSGGSLSRELLKQVFLPAFRNRKLNPLNDHAELEVRRGRIAFSTDSFVVDPLFFPGGNIGDLAVNGTVNDLAMAGALPEWMSVGFILEEGLPLTVLQQIVASMAAAARRAGVFIVTGDTKVVNRGKGDGVFINTSGIGTIHHNFHIGASELRAGDKLIVSGFVGDHGICILNQREGFGLDLPTESDTAPLHELVAALLDAVGVAVHALRDPTRGGVAAVLNEFAESSQVGIVIDEMAVPVDEPVRTACEILGLDPLHIANEGKLIAAVASEAVPEALAALRATDLGKNAAVVGEVTSDHIGRVTARTILGSQRMIVMPVGDLLPRIC